MPRPRPPYLNRVVTRHGKIVWMVRVGSGDDRRRVRLRAEYGTPEFKAEYEAAIAAGERAVAERGCSAEGTVAWLIERFRETTIWANLSPATRRERESFFKRAVKVCGDAQAYRITRESILASLDARAATPSQARHFLITMRALYRWAVQAGHLKVSFRAVFVGTLRYGQTSPRAYNVSRVVGSVQCASSKIISTGF